MSDDEQEVVKPFAIETAKQGRAKCHKCKAQCEAGKLRIAKVNANNPFGSGPMKSWYHIDCFFELKVTKNSKTISSVDDVDGWELLSSADTTNLLKKLGPNVNTVWQGGSSAPGTSKSSKVSKVNANSKDNLFATFQRIVEKVANEPSYNSKSQILQKFFREGTNKTFEGDLELWLRLLMPKDVKRVFNLQSKQIVKLFSKVFGLNHEEMLDDLSGGDVSETVAKFFEKSRRAKAADESTMTLIEVDKFLEELSGITQEEPQIEHFNTICRKKCTVDDLKTIVRLIKHDLKMNCGTRHVLDALHADAYSSFQNTRDLKHILNQFGNKAGGTTGAAASKSKSSGLQVMTAISPMLAEACKDFDKAIKKCPDGFYSEIKYDGERVQIHKKGDEFKFFSRNLKPVMDYKIANLKDYLPQAFPHADNLIVDSEILMVDTTTGDLLPFGTLGKHARKEFSTAVSCLFIFDCLYFNGTDLTKKPMHERRKFLEDNLTVIKHHVQLSEYRLLKTKNDLVDMTKEVLKKKLEGLVLKGVSTIYEPGKRRWLKVKKDYLMEGAIADTADLVILGAWYGTGKNGSLYSIFLMGCYDKKNKLWKTVTKVKTGLDDMTLERLHRQLVPLMEKSSGNDRLPSWISVNRGMIPNALAKDPSKMPVFEITGAEFSKSDIHTANSISIRFPRITKIRTDKSPMQATNMEELEHLYNESKAGANLDELNKLKSKYGPGSSVASIFTNTTTNNKNIKVESDPESSSEDELTTNNKNVKVESEPETSSEDELPAKKPKVDLKLTNLKGKSRAYKGSLKRRSSSIEDDDVVPIKKPKTEDSRNDIFKEFLLFCNEDFKDKHDDLIAEFKSFGGKLTDDSRSASLVIHEQEEIAANFEELRKIYSPNCRHYQLKWLKDSLKEQKLANPLKYFVKLHQI